MEYRFSEQLERILGSSAPSAGNEITYDIEDINEEEEESQDGDDDDLQFVSQTSRVEVGTVPCFVSHNVFNKETLDFELARCDSKFSKPHLICEFRTATENNMLRSL